MWCYIVWQLIRPDVHWCASDNEDEDEDDDIVLFTAQTNISSIYVFECT